MAEAVGDGLYRGGGTICCTGQKQVEKYYCSLMFPRKYRGLSKLPRKEGRLQIKNISLAKFCPFFLKKLSKVFHTGQSQQTQTTQLTNQNSKQMHLHVTASSGKHVRASHDWFWFNFLHERKTKANASYFQHTNEHCCKCNYKKSST